MPAFIRTPADEALWSKAKEHAGKKGGKQNWALTTYIFQKAKKSGAKKK